MFKIERCAVAPLSLEKEKKKKNGKYNCQDVVDQLRKDSFDKCYICEIHPDAIEVEHRLPHYNGKNKDRKFDWNNLFLSCCHCNNVKSNPKYDEGIIDCCLEDPEDLLDHRLIENNVDIIALSEKKEVRLTAELVFDVFNSRRTGILRYGSEYRLKRLQETMNVLYSCHGYQPV